LIGTAVLPATPASAGAPPWYPIGPSPAQRVEFRGAPPVQGFAPDLRVAPLGDVNGDGNDDVGAAFTGARAPYGGAVHVVFGDPRATGTMRVEERPERGLLIKAPWLEGAPVGLGDLDGDGLDDIGFSRSDKVVVVFGRRDSAVVDTTEIGAAAWEIRGVSQYDLGGTRPAITGIGDQNGDGRRDVAFADGSSVRVAFTPPNARGAVVTSYKLGDQGFALVPSGSGGQPFVGSLGDVNGDGRDDIAIAAESDDEIRAYGVFEAQPGENVALPDVARDGRGFEVAFPSRQLESALVVGDQNGDGRRDLAVGLWTEVGPRVRVVFSQRAPRALDFQSLAPDEGYTMRSTASWLVDVGDQSGDGIADVGSYDGIFTAEPATVRDESYPAPRHAFGWNSGWSAAAGALRDQDGDSRPEVLVANVEKQWSGSGVESAEYAYFVERSSNRMNLRSGDHSFTNRNDAWTFRAELTTPSQTQERWRPVIEVWDDGSERRWRHAADFRVLPAGRSDLAVELPRRAPGLAESQRWRMVLESESGATFHGEWKRYGEYTPLDYDYYAWYVTLGPGAPPASPGPPPTPPPGYLAGQPLRGTHNADHLVGTDDADKIFGYTGGDRIEGRGGDDHLVGGGQADTILGQSGDDRLDGQLGNDRLDGGAGHDLLVGREGDDRLTGGTGNDRLDGKAGRDRISAGAGSDRVEAADGERDTIACGKGRDVIIADKGDRVRRDCEVVLRRAKKKR
jgi:hypothetical protein